MDPYWISSKLKNEKRTKLSETRLSEAISTNLMQILVYWQTLLIHNLKKT